MVSDDSIYCFDWHLVKAGQLASAIYGYLVLACGNNGIFGVGLVPIIAYQAFRIPVELFLHGTFLDGHLPIQLTYLGTNFDVITGLAAIPVAWFYYKGKLSAGGVLAWNIIGLALVLNVVITGILSAPTPFQTFFNEPSNTLILGAPYFWLPAFLVQGALFGHLLVFRWYFKLQKT